MGPAEIEHDRIAGCLRYACGGAVLDRAIAGISTKMVVRIAGQHMYLWRAVDHEGEVLEILVQRRRDRSAAVKLMRKLLRIQGFAPTRVTTDKLRSYSAAFGISDFPQREARVEPNRVLDDHRRKAVAAIRDFSHRASLPVVSLPSHRLS